MTPLQDSQTGNAGFVITATAADRSARAPEDLQRAKPMRYKELMSAIETQLGT